VPTNRYRARVGAAPASAAPCPRPSCSPPWKGLRHPTRSRCPSPLAGCTPTPAGQRLLLEKVGCFPRAGACFPGDAGSSREIQATFRKCRQLLRKRSLLSREIGCSRQIQAISREKQATPGKNRLLPRRNCLFSGKPGSIREIGTSREREPSKPERHRSDWIASGDPARTSCRSWSVLVDRAQPASRSSSRARRRASSASARSARWRSKSARWRSASAFRC
jgi:hypothetical protein